MGRSIPSFREKLGESLKSIEGGLIPLLSVERRKAYERVSRVWVEEYTAMSCYSNPHLLTTMLLVAVLDLQAQILQLEERLRRLEADKGDGCGALPARV
ncbi:MAG: hypothetical protein NZ954_05940 [Thermofilaceae archaeon]|nr:hypothetical protein [Thermofilaceae archaeon]